MHTGIENKILVIEDDLGIRDYIQELLLDNGYQVETSEDGLSALDIISKTQPNLVLLDLGLPKITGEAICSDIRKHHPDLPIIILTAKDQPIDIVHGLNLGADDYISKPFVPDVLLARVHARLRSTEETILQVSDLIIHPTTFSVTRANKVISLSPHEFKLLHYLVSNKGRVLTREMILNRVWQYAYDVDTRVVDVYIGYLRKKIDQPFKKKLIQSIRGFGYVMKE